MKRSCIAVLLAILLGSCEKLVMEQNPADAPRENFEHMWRTLDERYSFFTFKRIDWDEVYDRYSARVGEGMSDEELFDLLASMLFELRDGHVNLESPFDLSRNWQWYLDFPENFQYSVVERNYLGPDHRITGPLRNTVIDSVGYMYYPNFSAHVSEADIDHVMHRFRGLKGVIIDIRNNGGGNAQNITRLASRFADTRRHVHSQYFKNGPGHEDFLETPVKHYVEPEGAHRFTGPVIVLSNRKCYSAATLFIQTMRVFPHVTIMGDSCGGGGGYPISQELPNGWIYRFSSDKTLTPEGFNIEAGIPPDVRASLDPDSAKAGIDTMIEQALDRLRQGS